MTAPARRAENRRPIHGWVVLDKPAGMSSNQAVQRLRRQLRAAKAGHSGTLDPLASGILPIALGEATKTVAYMMEASKDYRFSLAWGAETTTDDTEGEVSRRAEKRPSTAEIEAVLADFRGHISQVPPSFSAIKLAGKRAYALARDNQPLDLPAREVRIDRLELVENDGDHASFAVTTGKGAYIRSLARDLGRKLGTAAHVTKLRRCRVGPFDEAMAISLDFAEEMTHNPEELLHPVATALADIPALAITENDARRLRCGQKIELPRQPAGTSLTPPPADPVTGDVCCLACLDDVPVAIVRLEGNAASPQRVFNLS